MKKKHPHHRPRRKAANHARKPVTAAIIPAPQRTIIRRGREYVLNPEEIQLIKDTVAKGCDDLQLRLFLHTCKKHRLDPLVKQIYCVLWPRDNGKYYEMVIITGINGYRTIAARDHKDFAGTSKPQWTFFDPAKKTPATRRIPETCTISALRKGAEPAEMTVFWEEFAPFDLTEKRADFWNRMPKHMLAKVAEAQALRKAYPDLSDVYVEEEIAQHVQDLTDEGRQISVDGVAPSGAIVDSHANAKAAQQKILDEKLGHGHPPGTEAARNAEASLQRAEEADARLAQAKNVTPKPTPKKQNAQPATQKKTPTKELLTATFHNSVMGRSRDKNLPFLTVKLNAPWYYCFNNRLFTFLSPPDKLVGAVVEFYVDASKNIVGLKRVNDQYFADDGVTPIKKPKGDDKRGGTLWP